MKQASLVYAYYDNPDMLRIHLQEWSYYSPNVLRDLDIVIVDDGSPKVYAAYVVESEGRNLPIRLFRVLVDKPWGQDAARNIGMKEAEGEWCLMSDMDHLLSRNAVESMLDFIEDTAERGTYYLPGRVMTNGATYHAHPNTFLFNKADFWKMGGYDEDFVGFYGSDGNFRKCARGLGMIEQYIDKFRMILYSTKDCFDANTKTLSRKEGELWSARNPFLNKKRMGGPYRAKNPLRHPYQRII